MKKLNRVFIAVTLSIILFSCKSKIPSELKLIPKSASSVAVIDPGEMKMKLDKANISIDSIFNKLLNADSSSRDNKEIKNRFNDFRNNSGIDWSEKIYFFVNEKTYANNTEGTSFNIIVHLNDSSKLIKYLTKQDELKGRDIIKNSNYSFISLDYKALISWTNQSAMVSIFNFTDKPRIDSLLHIDQLEGINKTEEIKKEVNRYYSLKEDESIASITPFTDAFTKKTDAYFFHSTSAISQLLNYAPIQLPKLTELLQDNYAISTFNFDEGKIVTTSALYTNKTISAILKKYPGASADISMIENYPSANIDAAFVASFNPQVIDALIKELEIEPLSDVFLQKMDLKTTDLYKCFKGDIALVISDFSWKNKKDSSLFKSIPSVKYVFNASVGDTAVLHKLLNKAAETGFIVKQKNNEYKSAQLLQTLGVFLSVNNNNFILSTDSALYQQYIAKNTKAAINSEVLNQFKNKTHATYIDLEKIFSSIESNNDTANNSSSQTLKKTFKDIISTGEHFDGTKIQSNGIIRLKNEKENSLVTLLKLFMHIAPAIKKSASMDEMKSLPFIKNII